MSKDHAEKKWHHKMHSNCVEYILKHILTTNKYIYIFIILKLQIEEYKIYHVSKRKQRI